MEITFKKIILSLLLGYSFQMAWAQSPTKCSKAIEKENFKKVERLLQQQVRHHKNGQRYYNGAGSGYQTNFTPALDSITNWFKNQSGVVDTYWDKCQQKEAIYPGWSVIGVKFKTKKGIVEKCYSIQQGTTGNVNLLGWKPKLFKTKNKLVYKKSYDCKGFIELQKLNCFPYSKKDTIVPSKLIGKWKSIKQPKGVSIEEIEFKINAMNELELQIHPSFIYRFGTHVSKTALSGSGYIANWPPYNCFVTQLDDNSIQIEYASIGSEPQTISYIRSN